MFKKCGRLLCGLLLSVCFCMPVHAADRLQIQLFGTKINERTYSSPVSLAVGGAGADERILIKENGRWMSLSPASDGVCRLDFTEDGGYELKFCAEAADGGRSAFADVRFTIDRETASFIESCRRLPDSERADDMQILSLEEELLALQRRRNALDEQQQALIPSEIDEALSRLLLRLGGLRPQLDITPPDPPQIRFAGEAAAKSEAVYRGPVRLELLPPQADFHRLLMRTGKDWEPLEPVEGIYALECSASDSYRYDFCSEDAAGNRSPLVRAGFILSPGLFEFYQAVGKSTGLGVEEALRCYQLFDGRGCALVEQTLVRQLEIDYIRACEQAGYKAYAVLGGKTLRVLGMLSGFYGRQDIRLEASGRPVTEEKTAAGKNLIWEYTLSFTDIQGDAAVPDGQLLVSVQLPPEVLKKKNVAVVDSAGKLLESRLRNEDEGFVLSFSVPGSGVYSVGADV